MAISAATGRLRAFRQTKLYDLFAAAPLIAWYGYCAAQMLPSLTQQVALVKLFVQTDPSVLPSTFSFGRLADRHAGFLALLVVMFTVRRIPQRAAPGFYPRFAAVAGTFLSVGFLLLPPQELSYALYVTSLLLVIGGTLLATVRCLFSGVR